MISFVVPAYNEEKYLAPTLASIHAAAKRSWANPTRSSSPTTHRPMRRRRIAERGGARVVDRGEAPDRRDAQRRRARLDGRHADLRRCRYAGEWRRRARSARRTARGRRRWRRAGALRPGVPRWVNASLCRSSSRSTSASRDGRRAASSSARARRYETAGGFDETLYAVGGDLLQPRAEAPRPLRDPRGARHHFGTQGRRSDRLSRCSG